jgi:ABC-type multidrug transport system fused ATPase/permease subunit
MKYKKALYFLWKEVSRFKKELFINFILILSFIPLVAVTPFLIENLMQEITTINDGQGMKNALITAILILTIYSLTRFIWFLSDYHGDILKLLVKGNLREKLYLKVLKLPASYHKRKPSGELMARFTSDIDIVGEEALFFTSVFQAIAEFSVGCYVAFKLNTYLAIIFVCSLPIYLLCQKQFKPKMESMSLLEREANDNVVKSIEEGINSAIIIRLLEKTAYFYHLFQNKIRNWHNSMKNKSFYEKLYNSITMYIEEGLPIIILCIGAILSMRGLVDIPTLIAFFTFVGRLYVPVWNLAFLFTTTPAAFPSINRIETLLNQEEEKVRKGILFPKEFTIDFHDVFFSYEENNYILKNINLKISKGEKIAIVGSTGTGKSTLLLLLTELYKPQRGEILLNKLKFSQYDLSDLRRNIKYVESSPFIFNASIEENILLGEKVEKSIINKILEITQLTEFSESLNKNCLLLSSGQKQRVNLARTLLHPPKVLLLDEATSAMDSRTEELIFERLKEKEKDMAIILVSHRLSTIIKADKIYFMANGTIVDSGSHIELYQKNESYRELFKKQYVKDAQNDR